MFRPEGKCSQQLHVNGGTDLGIFKPGLIKKYRFLFFQGQKAYQCEICKQHFVNKFNLDNHMWQHKQMRARPFKCQLCKKAYTRQPLLDQHMLSHKGVKPYVCNECGKPRILDKISILFVSLLTDYRRCIQSNFFEVILQDNTPTLGNKGRGKFA